MRRWHTLRLRVGKEIGSAALVADGYHARMDGWTSLAVLFGAIGVYLGFPACRSDYRSCYYDSDILDCLGFGKDHLHRLLDGVDPEISKEIFHAAHHVSDLRKVTGVKVRWLGHRLHAEVNITVDASLSIEQGHAIAIEVRDELLHHLGTCRMQQFTSPP